MKQPTMAEIARHSLESYAIDNDTENFIGQGNDIRKRVQKLTLKMFGREYRKLVRQTGGWDEN